MKKLTAILMVMLCAFSLSAEWGRIRYIDEFGDVDHTISDPYQIADGTKEVNGSTNYYYEYRLIASLPTEFGYSGGIEIDMFDDFGDYVVFDAGDEATIRVKLTSGEIKEFTYDFTEHEYPWYDEYELNQVRQNIHLSGHDAVDLLNELYRGNDLRFVIYNGNVKYTFTIEAYGFKEIADEFIGNFAVPEAPVVVFNDDYFYSSVSNFYATTIGDSDYVLGVHTMGFPGDDEYPSLSVTLDYKDSDDVFWYDNESDFTYTFRDVRIVAANGNDAISLSDRIKGNEFGNYFTLYDDPKMISDIIDFANEHGSVEFIFEFSPFVEITISFTSEEMQELFTFPE